MTKATQPGPAGAQAHPLTHPSCHPPTPHPQGYSGWGKGGELEPDWRHRTHPTSLGVGGGQGQVPQEEPPLSLGVSQASAQLGVGRCHLYGEAGLISRRGCWWGWGGCAPHPKSWNEQNWADHPLASSWFPETSLGPYHQAPFHPWAWLLQTKTQKPDTLAPQVAVGTESGGQARAQAHTPAASTGSYCLGASLPPGVWGQSRSLELITAHLRATLTP